MAPSRDGVCAALAIELSSGRGEDCEGGLESGGEGKNCIGRGYYIISQTLFFIWHMDILYIISNLNT
jgi:hypothetical protein